MKQTHLTQNHAHTLEQIYQQPVSHNLEWREVMSLMNHHGSVVEGENGRLEFTLNGVTENFHRRHDKKDVSEVDQILQLRSFMERAGFQKDGTTLHQNSADTTIGGSDPVLEVDGHAHDHGSVNAKQNRRAEQQVKTQQREQNDRSLFQDGDAQAHQQGNRQS